MSVYLLATLDTKWREAALVRDRLVELDVPVTLVDTGCQGQLPSEVKPDVTRELWGGCGGALGLRTEVMLTSPL